VVDPAEPGAPAEGRGLWFLKLHWLSARPPLLIEAFGEEGKRWEVAVAQDFTLDDFRRQLAQNLKWDTKDLVGYQKNMFGHTPDPSEEDQGLALNRLHQMIATMTDEERHALNRLPRMIAAMTGEERYMLQLLWQSVQFRQMIDAMTDEERSDPDLIDSSRRTRIATNSGTEPREVEEFLAQFHQVRAVMRHLAGMSLWQRFKMVFGALWNQGIGWVVAGMLLVVVIASILAVVVVHWVR
jgi:signal recognition particle GTPase